MNRTKIMREDIEVVPAGIITKTANMPFEAGITTHLPGTDDRQSVCDLSDRTEGYHNENRDENHKDYYARSKTGLPYPASSDKGYHT